MWSRPFALGWVSIGVLVGFCWPLSTRLYDALGYGIAVFWAGWAGWVSLLLVGRAWPLIGVKALGWAGLTLATAGLFEATLSEPGSGGVLGLWLCERRGVTAVLALMIGSIAIILPYLQSPRRKLSQEQEPQILAATSSPANPALASSQLPREPLVVSRPTVAKSTSPIARPGLPPVKLLDDIEPIAHTDTEQHLRERAEQLERACAEFGITVRVVAAHPGPVLTLFELTPETGLRVGKVASLAEDLARSLAVPGVRIVTSIPGKNTIGVEIPNTKRQNVRIRELLQLGGESLKKAKLPLLLGKDAEGNCLIQDLADMPHLLVAGRTGTGKSVCLNSLIVSLLLTRSADECRLILIDPKKVELSEYGRLPHLMHPVVIEDSKAEAILAWAVEKMEERYELLRQVRVRNISSYNDLGQEEIQRRLAATGDGDYADIPAKLPYIVIIVDEVGDLMMSMKKEVESHIIRLAQKSRAAGIHLILTTQKPTVDVITGLIKSNLPARIAFQVTTRSDSRVVLDEMGAERLLGKGDMLFLHPQTGQLVRAQGTFASDAEISRIVNFLECEPQFEAELMALKPTPKPGAVKRKSTEDGLYAQAVEVVLREQRGSTSLLQRALGIGYGKAARFIDQMAEDGIVGSYKGAQAREVLMSLSDWQSARAESE